LSAKARRLCKSLGRFPGDISTDKVVSIERIIASGHIYNLQTKYDSYIVSGTTYNGNGIIAHNCRCTTIDLVGDWQPTARAGRNPVTGEREVFDYKDYKTWAADNGLKQTEKGRYYVPKQNA
jgi:hypothetical protein